MGGEWTGDAPYFFLSYARTPRTDQNPSVDPNLWVHKLYADLSAEVLELVNSPIAGFMDREIRVGMPWSRQLMTALATCKVFVPLYSPRYFASENCGKEWYVFSRRALDQKARKPETEMAIVPALWVPVDERSLPGVAREIQFNHHELGDRYGQLGFSGIIKVNRYQDDYTLAVQGLARRIVEVAREISIAPGRRTAYATSESAFGDEVHQMAEKRMQLAVVSLDTAHLPDGRNKEYYGNTPLQWKPYFPTSSMPIIDYAMELAQYLGCQPGVVTLEDHLREAADGNASPGLFLIDAWAALSPGRRGDLCRLDELNQEWTGVLHPWNREDTQTLAYEDTLRENLDSCLSRKLANIPHRYRMQAKAVSTIEDFGDVMAPMVMTMRRRFLRKTAAYPPTGAAGERPRLRARSDDDAEGTP